MSSKYLQFLERLLTFIGKRQSTGNDTLPNYVAFDHNDLVEERVIELWLDKAGKLVESTQRGRKLYAGSEAKAVELTRYLFEELENLGLIKRSQTAMGSFSARLTSIGWQKFDEISSKGSDTKFAFMAMAFSGEPFDSIYANYIVPAVLQTGYELLNVGDDKTIGLIDDKIRVNIRLSHFVIADLTSGNRGAYWEAGYAEALGKPVIYIIDRLIWENKSKREKVVHFDTEHQTIYRWDKDDMSPFLEDLKSVIRVNFNQATMRDE